MRKLLLIGVVFLATGLFVLPGIAGFLAQARQQQIVADMGAPRGTGQLALEQYERGWFSSRARYRYRIAPQWAGPGPGLIIESDLVHGPFPFTAWGRPGADYGPLAAWGSLRLTLDDGAGQQHRLPGELFLRVMPGGDVEALYRLPAGEVSTEEHGRVAWQETRARFVFDSATRRAAIEASSDGLGLVRDEQQLALSGLALNASFAALGRRAEMRVEARAARVQGSDWEGESALRFGFSDFDGRLLAAWLNAMASSVAVAGAPEIGSLLTPELQALIGAGGSLRLDELRIPSPDGALKGTLDVAVPVEPGGLAIPAVIGVAAAQLHLEMPQRLALRLTRGNESFRRAFFTMLQVHLLRAHENAYLLDADMTDGLLTVNGIFIPWLPGF